VKLEETIDEMNTLIFSMDEHLKQVQNDMLVTFFGPIDGNLELHTSYGEHLSKLTRTKDTALTGAELINMLKMAATVHQRNAPEQCIRWKRMEELAEVIQTADD
jgi:hypothetical protein